MSPFPSKPSYDLKSPFFPLLFLLTLQPHLSFSAVLYTMKHHHNSLHHQRPMIHANQTNCALFSGTWVRDDTEPLYQSSSCPIIDPQFNCKGYGRPDSNYLKYRWRPINCDLPRFNGVQFLMGMKGKTVMFVGDSLGKNQWESLICMIYTSVPQSQTQLVRGMPLSTFRFLDYGVTISFYRAPYLVEVDVVQGKRILRLDEVDGNGDPWRNADVLSFNSGHWWTHQGSLQGWDYIELGGKYYPDMDRLAAYEKGLKTWANWVDSNIDRSKTKVFFLGISPSHTNAVLLSYSVDCFLLLLHSTRRRRSTLPPLPPLLAPLAASAPRSPPSVLSLSSPNEWNPGVSTDTRKGCYGETAPISGTGTTYPGTYPDLMRVVDMVIREMNNPAYVLDITMLSAFRKDAHPSVYSGDLTPQQRSNPDYSDCSHWCLPGLPDTWNELFYTSLFY